MYSVFRHLLQEKGVSAYQVSKDTGVSQQTLSAWKNGKSKPSLSTVQKLADYFDVSVEYLLNGKDSNHPAQISPTTEEEESNIGINKELTDQEKTMTYLFMDKVSGDGSLPFIVSKVAADEQLRRRVMAYLKISTKDRRIVDAVIDAIGEESK